MRIFSKSAEEENKAVNELIEEQRLKESIAVYRRGWVIDQATSVLDDCSPDDVIRMAKKIYDYVYGDE